MLQQRKGELYRNYVYTLSPLHIFFPEDAEDIGLADDRSDWIRLGKVGHGRKGLQASSDGHTQTQTQTHAQGLEFA